jgi:hypothetical protein
MICGPGEGMIAAIKLRLRIDELRDEPRAGDAITRKNSGDLKLVILQLAARHGFEP